MIIIIIIIFYVVNVYERKIEKLAGNPEIIFAGRPVGIVIRSQNYSRHLMHISGHNCWMPFRIAIQV